MSCFEFSYHCPFMYSSISIELTSIFCPLFHYILLSCYECTIERLDGWANSWEVYSWNTVHSDSSNAVWCVGVASQVPADADADETDVMETLSAAGESSQLTTTKTKTTLGELMKALSELKVDDAQSRTKLAWVSQLFYSVCLADSSDSLDQAFLPFLHSRPATDSPWCLNSHTI